MTTSPTPPQGLTVRPATLDDAEAVCVLLNEVDLLEIGRADTELALVQADLKHPDVDLERDSWLLFDGDLLVGYALVWDESGGERVNGDHYVLPGRPQGALHLLGLLEARATERAAANGAARAVVHLDLTTKPTLDPADLRARGWRTVRHYKVLERRVGVDADPLPQAPPGVALRPCLSEEDRRRAHVLLQESFTEHFDHQPRTYAQWLDDIDAENVDWSLIWVAHVEGIGDVAAMRTRDNPASSAGWIGNLGVLAEARGRGIGSHLLRHAFGHYAALGRDRIGLGVDTDNSSGALALYERHGMTLDHAVDTWELIRPAA
ncbi:MULTISPECIES: GNAT family N-acetyltransferase [Streptomyces]|uniref:GNAT family N-acetyltransferase n=1 Tax=Streptomyces venezuelae TaxID=54571 RepID=A0A5P2B5G1_STRVZ|nr:MULTISPECIES: GNAT family N-acetyltransferase [Streptomyces]NEA00318.1 GNAT family N-acetyltransferase [Streptomyces sp. SID10116]MYY84117.1 GNAT family N-acetyltransferase [Streptomyces sp. SID335]MYZ14335.1 GNAT family N-acetyltransferase [Streptomyces sp. SID337]NDZ88819.1 GNAT family N-acetyltransferase [Streptomyces sp. SID10115]NEB47508.1 GNAT family N-acetyltransferase [Streptomyces sp. SID339]